MKTSLAVSDGLSIADAIQDEEALALEIQRLNLARLRYKIRATLRGNENREFLMKHL